jgi:hypothetical protein
MSDKKRVWKYCEECGIWSLCNAEDICAECEQEAADDEDADNG